MKKHYEKLLLSVVLLLLAAAAAWLSLRVKAKQAELKAKTLEVFNPQEKLVPAVDLKKEEAVLAAVKQPITLDLTLSNHVFNPVVWVKLPPSYDKILPIKSPTNIGPGRLEVTNRAPLLLTIALETVTGQKENTRYGISINNEAHPVPARRKLRREAPLNVKNDLFIIKQAGTNAETGLLTLTLEILNKDVMAEPEPVTFAKGKPFTRAVAYTVDLRYPPENLSFPKRRKGDAAAFDGDTYNIIAIAEKEITIQSVTTQKKYTIPIK
ncbi:MAG: hypothetical protein HZA89_07340 [Verrucomicrobia bacterium]|nr:hypothetical protein [Verrucomicrobiota bacterium]